jgi:S-disulfanyl-L-cysteine oxidoreductase SoxD
MSTRDLARTVAALALAGCASASAPAARIMETPHLGREATPAQVAGWDISVGPDGAGLPPGRGTAAMGATVYEQKCQVCHGAKGAGQPNDRLVGGQGTLAGKAPVRTIGSYWPYATTVFDYVRRAMPYTQPQSLTADETYAVTAYLLNLNGIIGDQDEMNAHTLPKVTMPNQANFILMYPTREGKRP